MQTVSPNKDTTSLCFVKDCRIEFQPVGSKKRVSYSGSLWISKADLILQDAKARFLLTIPLFRIEDERFADPFFGRENFQWRVGSGNCPDSMVGKWWLYSKGFLADVLCDILAVLLQVRALHDNVHEQRLALLDENSGQIMLCKRHSQGCPRSFTSREVRRCRKLLREIQERRAVQHFLMAVGHCRT